MRKAIKTVRDILRSQSDAELLWNLDEKAPDVQAVIFLELGRRKVVASVPHLRVRLSSADARVAEAAAEALGEIGDQSSAEDLLKLLLDRNQPDGVRDTCAFALAKLRYAPAISKLASALSDPTPSVRMCVAAALAALQNPEVRDQVEAALSIESDSAVRRALTTLLDSLPPRRKERSFQQHTTTEQQLVAPAPSRVQVREIPRVKPVGVPQDQSIPGGASEGLKSRQVRWPTIVPNASQGLAA